MCVSVISIYLCMCIILVHNGESSQVNDSDKWCLAQLCDVGICDMVVDLKSDRTIIV